MTFHPLIQVYGNADKATFPLILCIGREPNGNEDDYDDAVGRYDLRWDEIKNIGDRGVWGTAFWLVAQTQKMPMQELKRLSERYHSSMLAFTDISKPIESGLSNRAKITRRESIPLEWYRSHIQGMFSFGVIGRVELFLLHGLSMRTEFEEPYRILVEWINSIRQENPKVSCIDLPFFSWRNYQRIKESATPEVIAKIQSIYSEWSKAVLSK